LRAPLAWFARCRDTFAVDPEEPRCRSGGFKDPPIELLCTPGLRGIEWVNGRATVESALRLDIDAMIRGRAIQPGGRVVGEMKFQFYDDELRIKFGAIAIDPWDSWILLRYVISDHWTGEQHENDDTIFTLAANMPPALNSTQTPSHNPCRQIGHQNSKQ
jgi:hypothetical protein